MKKSLMSLLLICSPVWCLANPGEQVSGKEEDTIKTSSINWWSLVLSIGAIGISGVSYFSYRKENILLKEKLDSLISSSKDSNDQYNSQWQLLKSEIEKTKSQLSALESEVSYLKNALANKGCNDEGSATNEDIGLSGNQRNLNNSQSGSKQKSQNNLQVSYVSALNMDDGGNLSIPGWSLESDNTSALFKILYDPATGRGTYELNPAAEIVVANLDKLKEYADGMPMTKKDNYKTIEPGQLKLEGQEFKVTKKLRIG